MTENGDALAHKSKIKLRSKTNNKQSTPTGINSAATFLSECSVDGENNYEEL